jgi:hypothetical protein
VLRRLCTVRFGGLTGDNLGAMHEVAETVLLITADPMLLTNDYLTFLIIVVSAMSLTPSSVTRGSSSPRTPHGMGYRGL